LSARTEEAAKGDTFLIAKDGKPAVKVAACKARESSRAQRFSVMAGQIRVPDDFNTMGAIVIRDVFEGEA
jgi:antitoxin (DNA-binding transcriptional repressor) of toxin-antitoxin stability system